MKLLTFLIVMLGFIIAIWTGFSIKNQSDLTVQHKKLLYLYESSRIILLYLLGTIALSVVK